MAAETSGPNSVLRSLSFDRRGSTPWRTRVVLTLIDRSRLNGQCSTFRCLLGHEHTSWNRTLDEPGEPTRLWLLRKEVIQPHLPVRLPCYDLVLIASPTFDSSLHKGWATGFGCYRLS